MKSLDLLDWIAIALYFVVLAVIAIWVIRKKKNKGGGRNSLPLWKTIF